MFLLINYRYFSDLYFEGKIVQIDELKDKNTFFNNSGRMIYWSVIVK